MRTKGPSRKDCARLFLSCHNDCARKAEGVYNFQNRHRQNETIQGTLSCVMPDYVITKMTMTLRYVQKDSIVYRQFLSSGEIIN